ncbi:MAG: hypothetical protein QXP67_01875 [Desulfurococcaceae archaeon]
MPLPKYLSIIVLVTLLATVLGVVLWGTLGFIRCEVEFVGYELEYMNPYYMRFYILVKVTNPSWTKVTVNRVDWRLYWKGKLVDGGSYKTYYEVHPGASTFIRVPVELHRDDLIEKIGIDAHIIWEEAENRSLLWSVSGKVYVAVAYWEHEFRG